MINELTREILAQNTGRDPDRLALKLARLRADPFAFFRGTNALFLRLLPPANALFDAPCTLICGDLHLENFGAFKGDNRLCYFDVNDFDEACLAPFTVDLVRFIASIKVASQEWGLPGAQSESLVQRFVAAYTAAIRDGKPRWIERSLAEGIFRTLLRRAMRRTRRELLDRFTKLKSRSRRLRADGVRAFPPDAADRLRLRRFLDHVAVPAPHAGFFKLIDAARRIAGNGSLGLARYSLLVRGRGSPEQNFILDLKLAAPSAVAAWYDRRQPKWPTEAVRVVTVQRIVQAIAPALLHAVEFRGRPFVLKELQPSIDRFDLGQWREKPRRITQAIEGMGRVAAWAHLRGCGHYGADSAEALQAYVAGKRWAAAAERLAGTAAKGIYRAWKIYAKDYDAGAVGAAIEVR